MNDSTMIHADKELARLLEGAEAAGCEASVGRANRNMRAVAKANIFFFIVVAPSAGIRDCRGAIGTRRHFNLARSFAPPAANTPQGTCKKGL